MGKKSVVIMPQAQRILEQMGEQIKLARLRRRLWAGLVAERAGISRATLWSVEKGVIAPVIRPDRHQISSITGLPCRLIIDLNSRIIQYTVVPVSVRRKIRFPAFQTHPIQRIRNHIAQNSIFQITLIIIRKVILCARQGPLRKPCHTGTHHNLPFHNKYFPPSPTQDDIGKAYSQIGAFVLHSPVRHTHR